MKFNIIKGEGIFLILFVFFDLILFVYSPKIIDWQLIGLLIFLLIGSILATYKSK